MFLIKLMIPPSFKKIDPTRVKNGQVTLLKAKTQFPDVPQAKLNWEQKLKVWKKMQTSKGTIKNLTEIKSEIWDSGITSVMALLQTSIEKEMIQKQVE